MAKECSPMQRDECREEFKIVFAKLDRIDVSLRGNGKPGILLRLDRLERPERARSRVRWAVVTACIASGVGAAVAAIVAKLGA